MESQRQPIALQALERISQLYGIETKLRDLSDSECVDRCQRLAKSLLDNFKTWLDATVSPVLDGSGLAKAIAYTRKRWGTFARYPQAGTWPIDNNLVDRAIRPIAIGRKN